MPGCPVLCATGYYFWRRGILGTIVVGMAVYLPLHIRLGLVEIAPPESPSAPPPLASRGRTSGLAKPVPRVLWRRQDAPSAAVTKMAAARALLPFTPLL